MQPGQQMPRLCAAIAVLICFHFNLAQSQAQTVLARRVAPLTTTMFTEDSEWHRTVTLGDGTKFDTEQQSIHSWTMRTGPQKADAPLTAVCEFVAFKDKGVLADGTKYHFDSS